MDDRLRVHLVAGYQGIKMRWYLVHKERYPVSKNSAGQASARRKGSKTSRRGRASGQNGWRWVGAASAVQPTKPSTRNASSEWAETERERESTYLPRKVPSFSRGFAVWTEVLRQGTSGSWGELLAREGKGSDGEVGGEK